MLLWCESEDEKQDVTKMFTDFVVTNYPVETSGIPSPSESSTSEASAPKKRKVIFSFMDADQTRGLTTNNNQSSSIRNIQIFTRASS